MNISQPTIQDNDTIYAKSLITNAFNELKSDNFQQSKNLITEAYNLFKEKNNGEYISICLSTLALIDYINDSSKINTALSQIEDAKFLVLKSENTTASIVLNLALGYINACEKNTQVAKIHYDNAKNAAIKNDELGILDLIRKGLNKLPQSGHSNKRDPLLALVKIGQAVSAETDIAALLKVITEETKDAIQADRCTVFLFDKENNEIWSKIALGIDSSEIRFPAGKGLAGHVIKTGQTINIKEAYTDERFNKEIDMQTGYKTKTILCMPIKNLNQEIIGAFQVLNKLEGCFTDEDEDLLIAIGSSAGIALENAQLFKKQQELLEEQKIVFDSFIETLAASIDARDKITSGHSSRVRMYASLIAEKMNLDDKKVEILEKAATLHDIGKIGIRDSVLQKEGKLTDEEYKHIQEHVTITRAILEKIHMSDDFKMITEIACSHHEKWNGKGYAQGLEGENIPLGGRILAVSDVFDAITSKRHYRDKMPIQKVLDILIKDSGSHFDKNIVDNFLQITTNKIIEIFLTENQLELKEEDKNLFEKYTLLDLFNLFQKDAEILPDDECNLINLFNKYYLGHDLETEKA